MGEFAEIPLARAAAKGKRSLAQKLVEARAEIGYALHGAVEGGHGQVVDDLLEAGASVAATDSGGRTPLHIAAREGKTEMVQLFLVRGADIGALDDPSLYRSSWPPKVVMKLRR